MTLAIERHDNALWLVAYARPDSLTPMRIARFESEEAAAIYTQAATFHSAFCREVGRSGLG